MWLKHTRGCVKTAASLVVCADVKLEILEGYLLYYCRQILRHRDGGRRPSKHQDLTGYSIHALIAYPL
jgi:hypothetical protein